MGQTTVQRTHEICCGHRVYGHENKCSHLHGHNYVFEFTCISQNLDNIGRVIDFSQIKQKLCQWLEENWDHKFLIYEKDPLSKALQKIDIFGVVITPFNPTAENMAEYIVNVVAPLIFNGNGVILKKCTIHETQKCSASYERN